MAKNIYRFVEGELSSLVSPRAARRLLSDALEREGLSPETAGVEALQRALQGSVSKELKRTLPEFAVERRLGQLNRHLLRRFGTGPTPRPVLTVTPPPASPVPLPSLAPSRAPNEAAVTLLERAAPPNTEAVAAVEGDERAVQATRTEAVQTQVLQTQVLPAPTITEPAISATVVMEPVVREPDFPDTDSSDLHPEDGEPRLESSDVAVWELTAEELEVGERATSSLFDAPVHPPIPHALLGHDLSDDDPTADDPPHDVLSFDVLSNDLTGEPYVHADPEGEVDEVHAERATEAEPSPGPQPGPQAAAIPDRADLLQAEPWPLERLERAALECAQLEGARFVAVFDAQGQALFARGSGFDTKALARFAVLGWRLLSATGALRSYYVAQPQGQLFLLPLGGALLALVGSADINVGLVFATLGKVARLEPITTALTNDASAKDASSKSGLKYAFENVKEDV